MFGCGDLEVNSRQLQFVARASAMAIPNAEELARTSVAIGQELARERPQAALERLEILCDRMHHFLNFVGLSEIQLRSVDEELAEALLGFKHDIFSGIDAAQHALVEGNLSQLGVVMTRGLSVNLLQYRSLGERVTQVLDAGQQAA